VPRCGFRCRFDLRFRPLPSLVCLSEDGPDRPPDQPSPLSPRLLEGGGSDAFLWIVKALTTAMGESTSDFLVHALVPEIAVILGGIAFVIALYPQFTKDRCVPWAYWPAVAMVGVFGTMAADVLHVGLGVPYIVSTILYGFVLVAVFRPRLHLPAPNLPRYLGAARRDQNQPARTGVKRDAPARRTTGVVDRPSRVQYIARGELLWRSLGTSPAVSINCGEIETGSRAGGDAVPGDKGEI
jgi:hypothetical protein